MERIQHAENHIAGFSIALMCSSSAAWSDKPVTIDVLLETQTTMSGHALTYPASAGSKVEGHIVSIEAGAEVGRHKHPFPVFMYVLEGILIVEHDDGSQATYRAGEALVEDANVWINNKNPGDAPVKFLGVLFGEAGAPTVIFPD